MKYLIWLLIVLAGIWWIRKQRQSQEPNNTHNPTPPTAQQPTTMLPCAHCGVLCPENDTVAGKLGRYCSDAHRQSHEG
jgi:uncharacterized protein